MTGYAWSNIEEMVMDVWINERGTIKRALLHFPASPYKTSSSINPRDKGTFQEQVLSLKFMGGDGMTPPSMLESYLSEDDESNVAKSLRDQVLFPLLPGEIYEVKRVAREIYKQILEVADDGFFTGWVMSKWKPLLAANSAVRNLREAFPKHHGDDRMFLLESILHSMRVRVNDMNESALWWLKEFLMNEKRYSLPKGILDDLTHIPALKKWQKSVSEKCAKDRESCMHKVSCYFVVLLSSAPTPAVVPFNLGAQG